MKNNTEELISAKENRIELQNELMEKYNLPLLYMRINYYCMDKKDMITNNILQNMGQLISDIFNSKIKLKIFRITVEGPSITLLLDEDPIELKKLTIQIEDKHILGPCIDIDVYDNKAKSIISRKSINLPQRKCFICGDLLKDCIKSSKHDKIIIDNYIEKTYKEFMKNFFGKVF